MGWRRRLSPFPGGCATRPKSALERPKVMRSSLAFALLAAAHAPAQADFRVCNRTRVLINLAVGTNAGDDFATEGWWTVTPGSCATPVRGPLRGRYVYLYATGIDGADVLKGTVSMCIDRGKFKAYGIENCWRRGLEAVAFAEIDTLDSPDWTTFLTDVGK
jgi:uncharacterized membrane protein